MPDTCMGGKTMSKIGLFTAQVVIVFITAFILAWVPGLTIATSIAFSVAGALLIVAGACLAFDREGTK